MDRYLESNRERVLPLRADSERISREYEQLQQQLQSLRVIEVTLFFFFTMQVVLFEIILTMFHNRPCYRAWLQCRLQRFLMSFYEILFTHQLCVMYRTSLLPPQRRSKVTYVVRSIIPIVCFTFFSVGSIECSHRASLLQDMKSGLFEIPELSHHLYSLHAVWFCGLWMPFFLFVAAYFPLVDPCARWSGWRWTLLGIHL